MPKADEGCVVCTLCLKGVPLTRRFAPPSPRKRGEGRRVVALLPACGEKVPEGRMRGCEKCGLAPGEGLVPSSSIVARGHALPQDDTRYAGHLPMQNFAKISVRTSSRVIAPVSTPSAFAAR